MKTESVRGMRDVPTIQGLRNRALPTTRAQAVTEVARLEHEKARLQRELEMWQANEKKTSHRLARVQERLALLQHILDPAPVKKSTARRRKTRQSPDGESEGQAWREMKLEY
jgi:hypothetical protein